MEIVARDNARRQLMLQCSVEEWEVVQWIAEQRTLGWFAAWLKQQFSTMSARRHEELAADLKRKYSQASFEDREAIQRILGMKE